MGSYRRKTFKVKFLLKNPSGMSHNIIEISKNWNGKLEFCKGCKKYYLSFNNVFLIFNRYELNKFIEYLSRQNFEGFDDDEAIPTLGHKVLIPTMQDNLILLFSKKEINALKSLLENKCSNLNSKLISAFEIDYTFMAN